MAGRIPFPLPRASDSAERWPTSRPDRAGTAEGRTGAAEGEGAVALSGILAGIAYGLLPA